MPRLARLVALSQLPLALLGCAMNQTTGAPSQHDPNVITRAELEEHHFNTVYDVVETLRAIVPDIVSEMRHLNAGEASARWGLGHGGGVISISTKPAEGSRGVKDNP